MSNLLIVACSQRKQARPVESIPALERYDGTFFRVLRKWLRSVPTPRLEILIISTRFGLIAGKTLIPNYDQRMTASRAKELAPDVPRLLAKYLK